MLTFEVHLFAVGEGQNKTCSFLAVPNGWVQKVTLSISACSQQKLDRCFPIFFYVILLHVCCLVITFGGAICIGREREKNSNNGMPFSTLSIAARSRASIAPLACLLY